MERIALRKKIYKKHLQQKNYTSYLDEAFGLEPLGSPGCREPQDEVQTWPCVPRKQRYLSSADSILDLPTYSLAAFPELLDWSNDNILVAALGMNYHKWSWRTQSLINKGFARNEIQCCKFDPRGEMLILGTDMKMVEVHNNLLSKWVAGSYCRCLDVDDVDCSITALDWSPTGNSFITGCSRGMLVTFDRNARLISWRRVIHSAVLVVRVSPDARYVAVAAVNATIVLVLSWPGLELTSSLNSEWTVKTLTWHPWRSALLGIGAVTTSLQSRIAFWDAASAKVRETNLGRSHYSLDCMLFSHRTGEMVLSLWNADPAAAYQKTCSHLVVMSDPETVVDHWGEGRSGLDRVRTMIFSPDGTKLATATADEDLIIWNFLPEDPRKKKTNCRQFSAMPVYLDKAMYGYSLR
ncbi:protein cortex-like isoform X2 [Ostrinia furnacalis]|uniref:protein cortex-like isoform X2 n=1 Tax=Ostrinia furnacalis TaxID=93504 RepID=UPI00103FC352|nr:protein cortex-like isoform X2 [Ostrinia furnacalis]